MSIVFYDLYQFLHLCIYWR